MLLFLFFYFFLFVSRSYKIFLDFEIIKIHTKQNDTKSKCTNWLVNFALVTLLGGFIYWILFQWLNGMAFIQKSTLLFVAIIFLFCFPKKNLMKNRCQHIEQLLIFCNILDSIQFCNNCCFVFSSFVFWLKHSIECLWVICIVCRRLNYYITSIFFFMSFEEIAWFSIPCNRNSMDFNNIFLR